MMESGEWKVCSVMGYGSIESAAIAFHVAGCCAVLCRVVLRHVKSCSLVRNTLLLYIPFHSICISSHLNHVIS